MAELLNSEQTPKENPEALDQVSQPASGDSERPVKALQNFVGLGSDINSSEGRTSSTGASAKAPTSGAHLAEAPTSAASIQKKVTDPLSEGSVKARSAGAKRAAPAAKPATYSEG